MALIGGAGNPVGGSNPAGLSAGLNYIGKYAYGYNSTGLITNASGETTLFEFQAGTPLQLNFSPGANISTLSQSNKSFGYRLYLDDSLSWAMLTIASSSNPEQEQSSLVDKQFMIAQYTNVKITCQSTDDGGATFFGALSGVQLLDA